MIQYSSYAYGNSIVRRYYNGDGREIKRAKTVYDEQQAEWVVQNPEYFIRSSVLGGETLTEVNSTGKKVKTHVIAAGAKIATQSQYTYNNNDHKSVGWNHSDASGMSHRSTIANGAAIWGDGQFDGQPAETDPLGGNMGTETPYIEDILQPPPQEPDGNWGFIPLDSDAPMMVNGQQVTCNLDGMAVPCSMAMQALESGSAIPAALAPYQHLPGFRFESRGLGVYTWNIPGYWFQTPNGPSPSNPNDPNAPINIGSYGYQPPQTGSFSVPWSNISWGRAEPRAAATTVDESRNYVLPIKVTLKEALDSCLTELFGVSLTSFRRSEKGKDGATTVNFVNPDFRQNGLTGFGIVNNVDKYTRKEMRELINKRRTARGENPLPSNGILYGVTLSEDPLTNYTVSDETSALDILKTQIHELGHSVHFMMQKVDPNHPEKVEAGQELEDCVKRKGGFARGAW